MHAIVRRSDWAWDAGSGHRERQRVQAVDVALLFLREGAEARGRAELVETEQPGEGRGER